MKNGYFALLLCVAVFLPNIATAQFFATKSVVVGGVYGDNGTIAISERSKDMIRAVVTHHLVQADEYKVYDYSMERIADYAKSQYGSTSENDIAKSVGDLYGKINYVIFTKVHQLHCYESADRHKILITLEFIDPQTQSIVHSASCETLGDYGHLQSACAQLMSKIL